MAVPVNASIVEHFCTLEDPRMERTKKHNLLDILVIALGTLLTGGEGFNVFWSWNGFCRWSEVGLHGRPRWQDVRFDSPNPIFAPRGRHDAR